MEVEMPEGIESCCTLARKQHENPEPESPKPLNPEPLCAARTPHLLGHPCLRLQTVGLVALRRFTAELNLGASTIGLGFRAGC